MIIVTVQLASAVTGETTMLGRMAIDNQGDSLDPKRGNYGVRVARKDLAVSGDPRMFDMPLRRATVLDYPRLSYNMWRLVLRALTAAFPEEKAGRGKYRGIGAWEVGGKLYLTEDDALEAAGYDSLLVNPLYRAEGK